MTKGHLSKTCKKRLTCHSCDKKHPTLLHIENGQADGAIDTKTPVVATDNTSGGTSVQANSVTVTLPPTDQTEAGNTDHKLAIVPVIVKATKVSHSIKTYAFLDPGCSATFCTEKLSVRGRKTEIQLQTMSYEKPVKTFK